MKLIGFSSVLDGMKEQLVATIQRTFNVDVLQADKLYSELLQCVRKKNLITVFRPSDTSAAHPDSSGPFSTVFFLGLASPFQSVNLGFTVRIWEECYLILLGFP